MPGFNKRVVTEETDVPPDALHCPPQKADQVVEHCPHFRPVKRPPMARLLIVDDGRRDGEPVRLRADCTVIGRGDADISIDHDPEISSSHASIERCWADGQYCWVLNDLNSTNGVYVRASRCRLRQGMMLLIGSRRFAIEFAEPGRRGLNDEAPCPVPVRRTALFRAAALEQNPPAARFVESTECEKPLVLALNVSPAQLGSDPDLCQLVIDDDPLVDSRQALVYQDKNQRWTIEDSNSTNGLWVGIGHYRLKHNTMFQLGEQRFVFKEF